MIWKSVKGMDSKMPEPRHTQAVQDSDDH